MIKRIALFLTLALCTSAAFAADYSGQWKLDLAASDKLPERMKARVATWELTVKNDPKDLAVDVAISNQDGSAMANHFLYKLDGSDSPIELTARTPDGEKKIPGVTVAKVNESGAIALTTTTQLPGPGGETFTRVSRELWTLSDGGKTLTVHRVDPNPMGTNEYDLVFRKQ